MQVEATSEASHWRFAGLRRLFARELARLAKMRSRSINGLPLVGQPQRVGRAPPRRYYFNWLVRQLIGIFRVRLDSEGDINNLS